MSIWEYSTPVSLIQFSFVVWTHKWEQSAIHPFEVEPPCGASNKVPLSSLAHPIDPWGQGLPFEIKTKIVVAKYTQQQF